MRKTTRLFFCFFVMIFLSGWNYPNTRHDDTLNYTIIPFDRMDWLFEDIKKATLSKKELKQTLQSIKEIVRNYNDTLSSKLDTIPDLSVYKIQLLPFTDKKDQKLVGVIFLCKVKDTEDTNWKEDVILATQYNTTCYFKFILNLSKSTHTPVSFKQDFDDPQ